MDFESASIPREVMGHDLILFGRRFESKKKRRKRKGRGGRVNPNGAAFLSS